MISKMTNFINFRIF